MRSFSVVEDKIVNEFFSEAGQIIDKVEVMVDKLFLQGPVESFNAAIDLRAAWIGKVVGYPPYAFNSTTSSFLHLSAPF